MISKGNFWEGEKMLRLAIDKLASEIQAGKRALLSHYDPNPVLELANILSQGIEDFSDDSLSLKIITENYQRLHMVSFDPHVFNFKITNRGFKFIDAAPQADPQELIQSIRRGVDVGCREMKTGQNVLHILCARRDQYAIGSVIRVLFTVPEFDRLVSQEDKYGKKPVDYLPRRSPYARILAYTRKTRALCFLYCTQNLPREIQFVIADKILCPQRRHTETPLPGLDTAKKRQRVG